MQRKNITLLGVILICLNTVIGGGIFVNPPVLAKAAGGFGFLGYFVAALLLFPLILTLAELAQLHPVTGGLYVYSREYLSELMGFLSGWSYFLSRSVSPALLIHLSVTYLQPMVPWLQGIPIIAIDYGLIIFLVGLNLVGMQIGGPIQYLISFVKLTPLLCIIISGIFFATPYPITAAATTASFTHIIPISLYAIIGFEIICAISGLVVEPEKNIKKALFVSFAIVVAVAILFQFIIYRALGPDLAYARTPVLFFFQSIFPSVPWLAALMNGLACVAIMGGSFSILSGNSWNLARLGENNHLPFGYLLAKTTSYNVPWVSLIVEGMTSCLILSITKDQVTLQNIILFALFISYALSALALYKAIKKNKSSMPKYVPIAAIILCLCVIGMCLKNIVYFGISFSFLSIFLFGCLLALSKKLLWPSRL